MLDKNTPLKRLALISLLGAVFIIYINIIYFPWEYPHLPEEHKTVYLLFFAYRYVFFFLMIFILLAYNLRRSFSPDLKHRLRKTFAIGTVAYLLYVGLSYLAGYHKDCFTGTLLFQFTVAWLLTALTGHLSMLSQEKRRKEQEIEQLKVENLQGRVDALMNQIHPHFFFNSLNGITSLIRKKNDEITLAYVNKMSDVFRYIIQSDKKGLVALQDELNFVEAFRYMMEVRFANKLEFDIEVDCQWMNLRIPVLSLLPVIDNVVVHNVIDSEHKMKITIRLNENKELVVTNPVFPKFTPPDTNGTGLKNLDSRFFLLLNHHITTENKAGIFTVYLPLTASSDETADR